MERYNRETAFAMNITDNLEETNYQELLLQYMYKYTTPQVTFNSLSICIEGEHLWAVTK